MQYSDIEKMDSEQLENIRTWATKELRKRRKQSRREKKLEAIPYINPGDRKRMFTLYVLMLEQHKFYIGITAQKVEKRFRQHLNGKGAKWTAQHRPIAIIESERIGIMTESEATIYEREKTHEYIEKHGANNVRGGDLCYTSQDYMDKKIEESYRTLMKAKERAALAKI
jgi:predicted GIY-YIG superfamily endonuclease